MQEMLLLKSLPVPAINLFVLNALLLLLFVTKQAVAQEGADPEALENYCLHKPHHIIGWNHTCCNSSVLEPGISLAEFWAECTTEEIETSSSETQVPAAANISDIEFGNLHDSAWGVYSCIIQKSTSVEGSSSSNNFLTLKDFAEAMTLSYPQKLSDRILKAVQNLKEEDSPTELSDFKALKQLRETYFEIEEEVCKGEQSLNHGSREEDAFLGPSSSCVSWKETFHRGGTCCLRNSLPFDPSIFSPYLTIGYPLSDYDKSVASCRDLLGSSVLKNVNLLPWTVENALAEVCELSCRLMSQSKLSGLEESDFGKMDSAFFKPVAQTLVPSWLPVPLQRQAVQFALNRLNISEIVDRIRDFQFPDAQGGGNSPTESSSILTFVNVSKTKEGGPEGDRTTVDFMLRKFPASIIHVPAICSAHQELSASIQLYLLTESCGQTEESE